MKNIILTLTIALMAVTSLTAQSKRRFSHEEFQARQQAFITEHAKLTTDEAKAFFPLFFELQKSKWLINKDVRKKVGMKRGQQCTEEQCTQLIHEFADAKVKIAELEKEYIDKYLTVIPARKILGVQRAEEMFQREMLKNISQRDTQKEKKNSQK